MKYIMFHTFHDGVEHFVPIIFPDDLVHKEVAQVAGRINQMRGLRPIRAGTLNIGGTIMGRHFDTTSSGLSETLGLQSLPIDARIIKQYEYGGKFGQFIPD